MGGQQPGTIGGVPIKPIDQPVKPASEAAGMLLEIDVSHYEPVPDYVAMMKEGRVKRVYAKATEHALDSLLYKHVEAAQAAGFPVGAYHFMHGNEDGLSQAKRFLAAVRPLQLQLPHCLDWESGSADGMSSQHQQAVADPWLNEVEQAYGVVPEIYGGESFLRGLGLPSKYARYPLWLAHYQTVITHLHIPQPWIKLQGWQYTDSESVAGLAPGRHVDASWLI